LRYDISEILRYHISEILRYDISEILRYHISAAGGGLDLKAEANPAVLSTKDSSKGSLAVMAGSYYATVSSKVPLVSIRRKRVGAFLVDRVLISDPRKCSV
jgi:hypothetical protein